MLLLVEEVGCAEWLIVEDRTAWLECAILSNLKDTLCLLERHLQCCRLLSWLHGRAEAPGTQALWLLRLLGWQRYGWWRAVRQLWVQWLREDWWSCWDVWQWEDRFFLEVPLVDDFAGSSLFFL